MAFFFFRVLFVLLANSVFRDIEGGMGVWREEGKEGGREGGKDEG